MQVDAEAITKSEGSPLLEVELQLVAGEVCFSPELSGMAGEDVSSAFDGWVAAYLETAGMVARLDSQPGNRNDHGGFYNDAQGGSSNVEMAVEFTSSVYKCKVFPHALGMLCPGLNPSQVQLHVCK